VRPVLIVVGLVLAQDPPQMVLVPDAGAVQELASASAIQRSMIAFMRGVATLQSTVRMPASARTASNAAVKFDPRSRIMNLAPVRLLAEVHDQVAWLLGGPRPGWMPGDAEDADAPGRVLGQDVGLGAAEQVGREEVARQDRLGLGAQELRPGWPGPSRSGSMPSVLRICHTVDAATLTPRPASSPWILR
jgi:hypothetical protein